MNGNANNLRSAESVAAPCDPGGCDVSIVIPVYNEAQNIEPLYRELAQTFRSHREFVEMIWVDDRSTDDTWGKIRTLAQMDGRVRGIRLDSHQGKSGALNRGFETCQGSLVVTLDGDLQDNPAEIPRLVRAVQSGYDVVCGWKQARNDSWKKRLASRAYNQVLGLTFGLRLHDHNCGLKCLRVEVVQDIQIRRGQHRFITILAHARGYRVCEVPVRHRPRVHGKSKYGFYRYIEGIMDYFSVWFQIRAGQTAPGKRV